MSWDGLGEQTATVFRRKRIKASDYADDPDTPPAVWPGCMLVPMSSDEQVSRGLTVSRRWRLAASAGFTARAQDEIEVVPGPQRENGAPLRLGLDGYTSPAYDFDASVDHVEAVLIAHDA